MSWLSGWAKRIQLDIDSFYVDEDLTDFPVLITLSSGVGRNDADVRNIFSDLYELEIDYNNWNPDDKHSLLALSNNDLTVTATDTGGVNKCLRTIYAVSSGKWYWEITIDVGDSHHQVGIGTENVALNNWIGAHSEGYVYASAGTKGNNNSYTAYGDAYVSGDIIGVALDLDNGDIYFSKNGVWQNSGVPASGTNPAFSGLSGTFYAMHSEYYASYAATANFGDTSFSYSVPDGYNSGFYSWADADNTKKIMITTSDDVPCYTEIEKWDWDNEQAWLWTKVPTITSGTDTTLYLYYDKTQPDNDHYVGDTGDLAAKNVWDSSNELVFHWNETSGNFIDSTYNTNHAGDYISATGKEGIIGNGQQFDGSNDYAQFTTSVSLGKTHTTTALFKLDIYSSSRAIIGGDSGSYIALVYPDGNQIWYFGDASNSVNVPYSGDTDWHHIAVVRAGTSVDFYIDGNQVSTTQTLSSNTDALPMWYVGARSGGTGYYWSGNLDEIRVSALARSFAWVKADYYSCFDNLITFGSEELEPLYYFDGFVYEKNTPVSRTVRLYSRSTGSLMDTDTSRSSDGYYYVTSTSSGTHFLVAFDDDAGDEYNALILDKVSPKGTVY